MCKMQPEQNTTLCTTFIAKSKQPNLELGFLKLQVYQLLGRFHQRAFNYDCRRHIRRTHRSLADNQYMFLLKISAYPAARIQ